MTTIRVFLLLTFATLAGCASISGIQRAETLGLGRNEVAASVSGTGPVGTGSSGSTQFYPRLDLAGRTGVTDTVNLGAQFGTILISGNGGTTFALDVQGEVKVQLTDNRDSESSLVVSLAPTVGAGFVAGATTANGFEFNASLPLLVGIKVGPHEVIFGPRVVNALEVAMGQSGGTVDLLGVGASVGFAFRPSPGFNLIPEVAFNVPVVGNTNFLGSSSTTNNFSGFFLTFGVGALFDFGGAPRDAAHLF